MRENLLVVAGDNLFELNAEAFVAFARRKGAAVALKDLTGSPLTLASAARFSTRLIRAASSTSITITTTTARFLPVSMSSRALA